MDSRAEKDPSPIVPDIVSDIVTDIVPEIGTQNPAGSKTEEEDPLKPAKVHLQKTPWSQRKKPPWVHLIQTIMKVQQGKTGRDRSSRIGAQARSRRK